MKYTNEVVIHLPLARTTALFDDEGNLPEWQQGLQSIKHVSGVYGEPGSQTEMVFLENGRTVTMTETLIKRDLPHEIEMAFEANGVWNQMNNTFEATPDGGTVWRAHNTFRFGGAMVWMGWVSFAIKGVFINRTQADMERFKAFAESQA